MSRLNHRQEGFTISEMVVVVSLLAIVAVLFANFFSDNYKSYIELQQNTVRVNALSSASQRIARVLRGLTTITTAESTNITGYAYFTPRDSTLSRVRYFFDGSDNTVKVGVIPATGTAPNYTYNTASERITTIAENIDGNVDIFTYLDISGQVGVYSADTYKDIKGIGLHLKGAAVAGYSSPFEIKTSISLRNRKTNL
ncbi:type II secretion system protein [Candidatus Saccharibacteria bacterium]|nr:type II secretion system protein [Candidatus Saccharibacteria bacterium]